MVRVKLTKKQKEQAIEFAKKRTGKDIVDIYVARGGFKVEDILAGAYGELALYTYLKSQGCKVSKPDFTIHEKRSYAADLTCGDYKIHVKAQTLESSAKYGNSWLMQRHDKVLSEQNKDYIALTSVDLVKGEVHIFGVYSLKYLVDNNLIGECKVPSFRKTKVALYLSQINEKCDTSKHRWGVIPRMRGAK